MHFKNLTLRQDNPFHIYNTNGSERLFSQAINDVLGGFPAFSVYKEETQDDLTTTIHDNKSGDLIWEDINFTGIIPKIYGFTNVQINDGYKAIVYNKKSDEEIKSAFQKDVLPQNQNASYDVTNFVTEKTGSSMTDIEGVYSWGQWSDGYIDFARDNSSRHAYDNNNTYNPDLNGQFKLKSDSIQAPYYNAQNTSAAKVIEAIHGGDFIKE